MRRGSFRLAIAVLALSLAPLLMGALKPPEFPSVGVVSATQRRIAAFVRENGYELIAFGDTYRFFASQFGCRQDETAYLIVVRSPRDGIGGAGVCVQDGESGAIRPAPMRPVAGSHYEIDESAGDGGE